MKKVLIIFLVLISGCSKKDTLTREIVTRQPIQEISLIKRENTGIIILDSVYLASDFAITSTDKLVSREVDALGGPLVERNYHNFPDGFNTFLIHVEDFSTRTLLKTIDAKKILEQYPDYIALTSKVRVIEDNGNEFAEIRVSKKRTILTDKQTPDTQFDDFEIRSEAFHLLINLSTEAHSMNSIYSELNESSENQLISVYADSKNITTLNSIQSAYGGREIRIVQTAENLPKKNDKLYTLYPELKELKDVYDQDQIDNNYVLDLDHQKAYVIYFYDFVDENDIVSYFIDESIKR